MASITAAVGRVKDQVDTWISEPAVRERKWDKYI
jgi:hypothetical protein